MSDTSHNLTAEMQHRVNMLELKKYGLEFEIRALSVLLKSKQLRLSLTREKLARLKKQNNS